MSLAVQQWLARRVWHTLVWGLIGMSGWDAVGLLAGSDRWFAGTSYEVLRLLMRQIGGMRTLGVPLGLISLSLVFMTVWSYGRHSAGRRPTLAFPLCLSALAGWYAAWSMAIVAANVSAYIQRQEFLGWSSISKLAFVTLVAVVVASLPPPPPAPYGRRTAPAVDGGNGCDLPG